MIPTIAVAIGGAIGSVARFWFAIWWMPLSRQLPWGTIAINIIGSLIIGFFGALTLRTGRYPVAETWRIFVMVGLCGGFTTFSSFSLQTLDLLRAGAPGRAFANIVLSVVLCLGAVALGYAGGSHLGRDHQVAQMAIEEDAA